MSTSPERSAAEIADLRVQVPPPSNATTDGLLNVKSDDESGEKLVDTIEMMGEGRVEPAAGGGGGMILSW